MVPSWHHQQELKSPHRGLFCACGKPRAPTAQFSPRPRREALFNSRMAGHPVLNTVRSTQNQVLCAAHLCLKLDPGFRRDDRYLVDHSHTPSTAAPRISPDSGAGAMLRMVSPKVRCANFGPRHASHTARPPEASRRPQTPKPVILGPAEGRNPGSIFRCRYKQPSQSRQKAQWIPGSALTGGPRMTGIDYTVQPAPTQRRKPATRHPGAGRRRFSTAAWLVIQCEYWCEALKTGSVCFAPLLKLDPGFRRDDENARCRHTRTRPRHSARSERSEWSRRPEP